MCNDLLTLRHGTRVEIFHNCLRNRTNLVPSCTRHTHLALTTSTLIQTRIRFTSSPKMNVCASSGIVRRQNTIGAGAAISSLCCLSARGRICDLLCRAIQVTLVAIYVNITERRLWLVDDYFVGMYLYPEISALNNFTKLN